jgi:predicted DCC family thiol-disulfide oxidoreductase YuxK
VTLRGRWERFWFEPASPADLGFARVLFFALMFAVYGRRDFAAFAGVSKVFWQPVWPFRVLHLPPPAFGFLSIAQSLWKVSLLFGCAGLATGVATATAALLGTYLIGLTSSYGWIDHSDPILVFGMAILALSRCGDACSLDGLVRAGRRAPEPRASGEYRWPARMILLVMACVFFAAGVSKLRHSGLGWVTSGALSTFLVRGNDPLGRSVSAPLLGLGLQVARSPVVSQTLAATTLVIELLFPLALFSRWARRILVPASFVMLLGIQGMMGPDFARFLIAYVFLPPWHRLALREAAGKAKRGRSTVIYDGSCGLCQGTVAVLRRLDVGRRIEFLDASADWPRIGETFPSLGRDPCLETMHVVTARGRIETGFDGYRALAWSLPLAWPLAPLAYLPGATRLGRRVYGAVAARRHRTGCPVPASDPLAR